MILQFDQPQFTIEGSAVPIKSDESRLYWDPAPPKLDVAPAKVKEVLFPDYQRATAGPQERELQEMLEESSESEEEGGGYGGCGAGQRTARAFTEVGHFYQGKESLYIGR